MLACDRTEIDSYAAQGLWGSDTIDGLFRTAAVAAPQKAAFMDPPDKARFSDCPLLKLDYAQASRLVDALAAHFKALGFKSDDVVAVQLGNIAQNYLTLLALLRANLIACPLPPLWREHEITSALKQIAPRAIVTETRIGSHRHADMMRFVAADLFSVRHVLAFGGEVPDGLLPLDDILEQEPRVFEAERRQDAADHVATITWQAGGDAAPEPVGRSHNHWLAAARMHVQQAGLTEKDILFAPYFPTNLQALTTQLASLVMTGATLALYQAGAEAEIARRIADAGATYAVLPPAVLRDLSHQNRLQGGALPLRAAGRAWPSPEMAAEETVEPLQADIELYDIYAFGEAGLYVAAGAAGGKPAAAIPVGAIGVPEGAPDAATLLEAKLAGGPRKAASLGPALSGLLHLRGPMVPSRAVRREGRSSSAGLQPTGLAARGYMATGIGCRIAREHPPAARFCRREDGVVMVGSAPVSIAEAEKILGEHAGVREAALFMAPDPELGSRLHAAAVPAPSGNVSLADVQNYLVARKVGLHKFPHSVLALEAMPRTQTGEADRTVLSRKV